MPPTARRSPRWVLWAILVSYSVTLMCAGLVLFTIAVGPLTPLWLPVPLLTIALVCSGIRRMWLAL